MNTKAIEINEYQRYGRNKNTTIDHSYINSNVFRHKFDKLVLNKTVTRIIYQKAKEMLLHRSGTEYEDMYWIDGETGEVIASITNAKTKKEIVYTSALLQKLQGHHKIIAIHTHPHSMPPSIADFNSFYFHQYSLGIVVCHDGKLFIYQSNEEIRELLFTLLLADYYADHTNAIESNNLAFECEAQIHVLRKIMQSYDITFTEVK